MVDFIEERFPVGIAYGATGGPQFKTTVVTTGSGFESRNVDWSKRRGAWDVAHGIKTTAEYEELLKFFHVVKGMAIGFRFKDHTDYAATDTNIGTGDGETDAFQLRKSYTFGAYTYYRDITKPVAATTTVYVSDVEETGVTIDTTTGIVTFTPDVTKSGTDLFVDDEGASVYTFKSTGTDLSVFSDGQAIRTLGFDTEANNGYFTVTGTPSSTRMVVVEAVVDEAAGASATIEHNPAPGVAAAITADFEFDVPARFDTDVMNATLDDYGVHTWGAIPVVELRMV